jgi:hypothetical protein
MLDRIPALLACMLVALPVAADDGLWEWVTPRPQGHDLRAAARGNGVTVAVGRTGTVLTSADGIEWSIGPAGTEYNLFDITFDSDVFVAVGGETVSQVSPHAFGVVLTSSDGTDWVERHRIENIALISVVWTGTRFVAMGEGDRYLVSEDGLHWNERDLGEWAWTVFEIAWNGSTLVGLGSQGYWPHFQGSYFTSDDGEEWQQVDFDEGYVWSSVAALDGRFVAVGYDDAVLVSDDGLTWDRVPIEAPRDLTRVAASTDGFLAVGRNIVGTSPDGYAWTIDELPTESRISGLAWLGDGYLAVGEDGFMMSSPEGSQWVQLSEKAFDVGGSREINELAKGGTTIVGVGEGALIITGKHGTEWVRRDSYADVGELSGVVWNGEAFWTAGSYGIMRSIDGVHWARVLLDYDLDLFDITWNGSLLVAVGRRSSRDVVLTSAHGHDWEEQLFDLDGNLFTVGWTGMQFVAAGSGSVYLTSPDGVAWDQNLQIAGVTMVDMASDGGRLVAIGGRSNSGGVIYWTADGVQWFQSTLDDPSGLEFRDVAWTGTHFVAVSRSGGQSVFTSTDGFSWSTESTGTGVWPVSVVGDDRSLFATGRGLQIIRRTEPLADPTRPRRPNRRVAPLAGKMLTTPAVER